jgi:hypothetical protein
MKKAWMLFAVLALGCSKAQLPVQPSPTLQAGINLKVTAIAADGSAIDQAEVYLDGDKVGATPYVSDNVETGTHSLRVVKSGYRIFIETVQFEANKKYNIEAVMQPLGPSHGELFITIDQEGARCSVLDFSQNVISHGTTREAALLLSPGGYFVSAEKAGFSRSLVAVIVKAGEVTIVNLQMQPVNTPQSPQIMIAMPDSARKDEAFVLRWSSMNATRVDVDFVANPGLQGAAQVRFSQTGWHFVRAVAYNETFYHAAVDSIFIYDAVTPPPLAPTISLTAQPNTIIAGQKVNLTWRSTNATLVNVDYVPQASLNGSAQVQFDAPGSFTIGATAFGLGGQATAQATVVVVAQQVEAVTLTFSASPDTVEFGRPALLNWQTNGWQVIIDHGVGVRGPAGEEEVDFSTTGLKTITATAYGAGNQIVAKQARVYVQEAPQPLLPVIMLSVTARVDVNAPATITWFSQNADHVVVDYLGTVAASGTAQKSFATPGIRFITATAYNRRGYVSAADTVEVVAQVVEPPVADIILPAQADVRTDQGAEGLSELNVASAQIQKAGYYRIFAEAWFNSGDEQKNESFYILARHNNGAVSSPRDGNAGVYKVVDDEAGLPHASTRDSGTFYLDAGLNMIDMHHYAKISAVYPQFLNGPITGPESVSTLGFKLVYVGQ